MIQGARAPACFKTMPRVLAVVLVAFLAGCATTSPRTASTAMPVIVVRPGLADRIALMDRYRLHDEERKLMMARPRVWVEELGDEEASEDAARAPAAETATVDPAASR